MLDGRYGLSSILAAVTAVCRTATGDKDDKQGLFWFCGSQFLISPEVQHSEQACVVKSSVDISEWRYMQMIDA